MKANRGRDTGPEVALRRALHRSGFRFRKDLPLVIAGKRVRPDIVFTRRKVVIFVDGCFWHGCPRHGEVPASNREFWEAKIAGTRLRDIQQSALLNAAGWTVVRIWEHELVDDAVARVVEAVMAVSSVPGETDTRVVGAKDDTVDVVR
jgi:DNA mismatch endonuclease (patch repair protein)